MPKDHDMFSYIDPAAGATIMQLVVAGTVGIGAVVKLKWSSIKSLFNRTDQSGGPTADVEDSGEALQAQTIDVDES